MLTKQTITEIVSRHFKNIQNESLSGQVSRRINQLQIDILQDVERAADETALASRKTKNATGESTGDENRGGRK